MSTDLPPGPRVSSLRQLYQWSVRPLEMLDDCRNRFGDTFTIRLAGYGTIVMIAVAGFDPGNLSRRSASYAFGRSERVSGPYGG